MHSGIRALNGPRLESENPLGNIMKPKPERTPRALAKPTTKQSSPLPTNMEEARLSGEDSRDSTDSANHFPSKLQPTSGTTTQDDSAMSAFRLVIREELAGMDSRISDLLRHVNEVGTRVDSIETAIADVTTVLEGHEIDSEKFEREIQILQDKNEDLENRSRRSNLRFRGLPESMEDVPGTILALLQELVPDVQPDRLEMDRAHRALGRRSKEGPPRDIIVKFHFYATKEKILATAREKEPLLFQGHSYQIFPDLAPITIMKHHSFKPFLEILRSNSIKYRWGFPFKVYFTAQNAPHQATNIKELKTCFKKLNFKIPNIPDADDPDSSQESSSSQPRASTSQIPSTSRGEALKRLNSQKFSPAKRGR